MKNKISSTEICHPQKGQALKRLVSMFANISSIEKSKNDIPLYLQVNQYFRNSI
jgi:hypothetical protein